MKALVLGGGGPVGLAWELGVLSGLEAAGVAVGGADAVLGTSAGAFVGALLAGGLTAAGIAARQSGRPPPARTGGLGVPAADAPKVAEIFRIWTDEAPLTPERRARIGRLAVEIAGDRESPLLGWIARLADDADTWPAAFRATAVAADDGAFAVFDRDSGVPLDAAVAASCAVPGILPPVTIAGRPYVDGGVRSGTSADVLLEISGAARAPEHVLVVAPLSNPASKTLGGQMDRAMQDEISLLRARGASVFAIAPDAADLEAFGGSMMDASRSPAAAAAGRARGDAVARARELDAWRG